MEPPLGPKILAEHDAVFELLSGAGLTDADAVTLDTNLVAYTVGFACPHPPTNRGLLRPACLSPHRKVGPVPLTGHRADSGGRRSGLVEDHAADVEAVEEVLVALVDVVQAVGVGDELVEHELARPVQGEDAGEVDVGVGRAEE